MGDGERIGNFLIVDDEAGIREGLASFVRLRGHRVRTADHVVQATTLLGQERFDAVVTDWRLGDEPALAIVEVAYQVDAMPCFVMSGHPDEVVDAISDRGANSVESDQVRVLAKPLLPQDLVEMLEATLAEAESRACPEAAARQPLPVDAAARVDLVQRVCGSGVEVYDDGQFVTVRGLLPSEAVLEDLAACGGDLRVLQPEGESVVEIRFFRDSRPDGIHDVIRRDDAWPVGEEAVAIDLDQDGCSPGEFSVLLDAVATARADGRVVHLLNVPDSLRIWLETLGASARLPMRREAGPYLPEVIAQLWS